MDSLLDDVSIEIFRRLSAPGFVNLAPMLTVSKKHSQLAFSEGVLRMLSLDEFFNNADLINEGSAFRSFFVKCVAAKKHVAVYLESIRIAAQTMDINMSISLLFSAVPDSDYTLFARGIFLITADFPSEGVATISALFARVGSMDRMDVIGNVVYRHLLIFRPLPRRLFANLRVVDSIPRCLGNNCTNHRRCLNCFVFWFVVKFNNILRSG